MFDGEEDSAWSFSENRSIGVLTHGYHRYPAKFVPQLVSKLIENYTEVDHKIADVFAGCGTTLVESKVHGRRSVGVDINPVAQFITKVKTQSILPVSLNNAFLILVEKISSYKSDNIYFSSTQHPRIDYWFVEENKNKIAFLYALILSGEFNQKSRDFFLCSLSHILKNCSRWLQDSTKPQVDKSKKIVEVFSAFIVQTKKMMKKNEEFHSVLTRNNALRTPCTIKLADARNTRIRTGSINTIITSPPYVTSYEYADIHQLTGYWFEYITDITEFRKNFIGTFYSQNQNLVVEHSPTAQNIINQLKEKDLKMSREVSNYFRDMFLVAQEMFRILVDGGRVCLVIGNTELRKINIQSAEVFTEMLYAIGFEIEEVIKRSIPNKLIPSIRDNESGRFTKLDSKTSKLVYPNEYIIIAQKPNVNNQ